jgi:hypothetical protein
VGNISARPNQSDWQEIVEEVMGILVFCLRDSCTRKVICGTAET